jgi:hypothetical protein
MQMMKRVGVNPFVRRQSPESQFSHFNGTWEELVALVEENLDKPHCVKPGYRDGVQLVSVMPDRFRSGVVEVTESTPLRAVFNARRKGENPYIQVEAVGGEKLEALVVDIVLYRHDVLAADGDATKCEKCDGSGEEPCDACGGTGHVYEWEIISINARPTLKEEPMHPMAMARNLLGLPGGSAAKYTPEEFANAILYWSHHAMCGAK